MEVKKFIEELSAENEAFFSKQVIWATTYWAKSMSKEKIIQALRMRYWNEYVGYEVIARFMFRVPDPKFRMLVGRQVGDEAKHAYYVGKRILEMGGELKEPIPEQMDFYNALDSFQYPEEFFAAQQFTIETQSIKRNEQALKNLDPESAEVFRKHINDDEVFHVKLGHMGLTYYCVTKEAQERARKAARAIRQKHVNMSLANFKILQEIDSKNA